MPAESLPVCSSQMVGETKANYKLHIDQQLHSPSNKCASEVSQKSLASQMI
jgi:hypothetical protein